MPDLHPKIIRFIGAKDALSLPTLAEIDRIFEARPDVHAFQRQFNKYDGTFHFNKAREIGPADPAAAVSEFREGLKKSLIWYDTIATDILEAILSFDASRLSALKLREPDRKLITVLLGGMSWSGSSAVFDYLREFEETIIFPDEFQHFRKEGSIISIAKDLNNRDALRQSLLSFYFRNVIGQSASADKWENKAMKFARWMLLSASQRDVLAAFAVFIGKVIDTSVAGRLSPDSFQSYSQSYFRDLTRALAYGKRGRIFLCDNIIKINEIKKLNFLAPDFYFSVVRDPRDNFVARIRDDKSFNGNVESFITAYRKTREGMKSTCEELEVQLGQKVVTETIQFEDFVMQEATREQTAKKLSLCLDTHQQRSSFFPEQSAKNIGLFADQSWKKECRLIRKRLDEFCVVDEIRGFPAGGPSPSL